MQTKMKSLALMLTLALGMPAISQAAPLLADQGEPATKLARVPQANAWLEIDRQAFTDNIRTLQKELAGKSKICAVMKADAYGNSIDLLMPSILETNVECVGITSNAEAAIVRQHGYKGRIGNFINGELWGRVTDINAFWAMGFKQARYEDEAMAPTNPQWLEWFNQYGVLPRHPSQLYQFALEGLLLFVILWVFAKKQRPVGQISAVFLMGYGAFRFIAEFAREPDAQLGLLGMGLSMGQWLSLPMVLAGALLFVYCQKRAQPSA